MPRALWPVKYRADVIEEINVIEETIAVQSFRVTGSHRSSESFSHLRLADQLRVTASPDSLIRARGVEIEGRICSGTCVY